ncbi:MAG: OprO/OprP family phosphate-selective porin [Pseudomonadota bacterium]|nr:OprO/OprP family phosphate-selective porin [Pseudomonadota bacterium]
MNFNSRVAFAQRLSAGALLLVGLYATPAVHAGATFKIDDTKWLSIGAGLKTSFAAVDDQAGVDGDKWDTDFFLNNIRLYLNGQLYKYIKLTFNTECHNCSDGGSVRVLDAIARFEFNDYFNAWFGRTLVPAERTELDGPFYNPFFDTFGKSPFEPADFGLQGNTTFPRNDDTPGGSAGQFGRDDGVVLWGSLIPNKRLKYAIGAFSGLDNDDINPDREFQYAARLAYNFWNIEDNPGYYTSSTYYGKSGDILTLGVSNIYGRDLAGTPTDSGNFRGTAVDLLMEKVLPNEGVVTLLGEYKNYEISSLDEDAARVAVDDDGNPVCFCLFDGDSYSTGLLYLFPQVVGIGQFQPYVRYSSVFPDGSEDRDEIETGVNYVIDGHNARVSLFYQYGDLSSKGIFNFGPDVRGDSESAVKLGIQLQL